MCSFTIYSKWSDQAYMHTRGCNAVPLVWGSLRLAPIMIRNNSRKDACCSLRLVPGSWNSWLVSLPDTVHFYPSFRQLWTAALWVTNPMAKLITLLELHLDRQPPTVVTQATFWWERTLAHVRLQECGMGVSPPVNVCCFSSFVIGNLRTNIIRSPTPAIYYIHCIHVTLPKVIAKWQMSIQYQFHVVRWYFQFLLQQQIKRNGDCGKTPVFIFSSVETAICLVVRFWSYWF